MPNWCNNVVHLRHDDGAQLERARDAFQRGELLQEFVPCPEELLHTESAYYPDGDERQAALAAQEAANIEQYGFRNWYDWQVANWGTKWDVGGADAEITDGVLTLSFDSAWSPPVDAYDRLQDLGFDVEAFYYEPGMAFCGSWISGADICIDIPATSQEAEQVIPRAIDEMFGILENMAEWEAEEEAE